MKQTNNNEITKSNQQHPLSQENLKKREKKPWEPMSADHAYSVTPNSDVACCIGHNTTYTIMLDHIIIIFFTVHSLHKNQMKTQTFLITLFFIDFRQSFIFKEITYFLLNPYFRGKTHTTGRLKLQPWKNFTACYFST